MHEIQINLLELAQTRDLGDYSYRQLGNLLGDVHPYKVQHHLEQLIKKGKLVRNHRTHSIMSTDLKSGLDVLLSIPILGKANCGPAQQIASNQVHNYLRVSPSIIKVRRLDNIFALQAVGDSMNRSSLNGESIEDGDYVIVSDKSWGEIKNGDYVVSIIDDCSNIKKIFVNIIAKQIRLISESYNELPPIIIATEDLESFRISGKVEQVIKNS